MNQEDIKRIFIQVNTGSRVHGKKGYWYRCKYCNKLIGRAGGERANIPQNLQLEVDSTVPITRLNNETIKYLVPTCKSCNKRIYNSTQSCNKRIYNSTQSSNLTSLINIIREHKDYKKIPEVQEVCIEGSGNRYILRQIRLKYDTSLQSANDGEHYEGYFILEEINNVIYFRQANYQNKYILRFTKLNKDILDILLGVLGYIYVSDIMKLEDFSNSSQLYVDTFSSYVGSLNFININTILRGGVSFKCGGIPTGLDLLTILVSLDRYRKIENHGNINITLYSGGRHWKDGCIERGFTSTSYSFIVAECHAYTDEDIVMFKHVPYDSVLYTEDISAIKDWGGVSEREVTIKPFIHINKLTTIGEYSGHKLVVAEYSNIDYKQGISLLLNSISKFSKFLDIYLIGNLLNLDNNLTVLSLDCDGAVIKFRGRKINLIHNYNTEAGYYFNVAFGRNNVDCDTKGKCDNVLNYLKTKL